MSAWLYVLPEGLANPGPDWPCMLYQDGGPGRALALAAAAGCGRLKVVLPMEMFGWLRTPSWPGRRPSALAVAYALEEQIAGDIDSLQLFLTGADASRCYSLWFTDRARFSAVLALLHDLKPAVICIDADLLPVSVPCGVWCGGRWLVGGALPARLALAAAARTALEGHFPASMQWLPAEGGWQPSLPGFDLLGGKGRRRAWPWRSLFASAVLMGCLACAFPLLRAQHFNQQVQELSTANTLRFGQLFPQQAHVTDVAGRLRIAGKPPAPSTGANLDQLTNLAAFMASDPDLQVQRVALRPRQGWTLDVTVSHLGALERLKAHGPLTVQVSNATQMHERVQATVDIGVTTP